MEVEYFVFILKIQRFLKATFLMEMLKIIKKITLKLKC